MSQWDPLYVAEVPDKPPKLVIIKRLKMKKLLDNIKSNKKLGKQFAGGHFFQKQFSRGQFSEGQFSRAFFPRGFLSSWEYFSGHRMPYKNWQVLHDIFYNTTSIPVLCYTISIPVYVFQTTGKCLTVQWT